jgi:hypothetical protein
VALNFASLKTKRLCGICVRRCSMWPLKCVFFLFSFRLFLFNSSACLWHPFAPHTPLRSRARLACDPRRHTIIHHTRFLHADSSETSCTYAPAPWRLVQGTPARTFCHGPTQKIRRHEGKGGRGTTGCGDLALVSWRGAR